MKVKKINSKKSIQKSDSKQSIQTPPLPQTPMPKVNIAGISQQKNPITGLTRTETALLSPDEQEIARRT